MEAFDGHQGEGLGGGNCLSWQKYERRCSGKHRGRHIGGPGKEDYKRGCVKGEVKHLNRPVTKTETMKARQKGVSEICALNGFTEPAKIYAKKRGMKLFNRGRQVK